MNKKLVFSGMAAAALTLGALTSCTAESGYIVEPGGESDSNIVKLVNEPEVYAYSGSNILGRVTRAVETVDVVTWEPIMTTEIDRNKEKEIIDEWLPEQNGNMKEGLNTDFLFHATEDISFDLYPVFSHTNSTNSLGVFYYDAEGERHEVIVWDDLNPWALTESRWEWTPELGSYEIVSSKGVRINIKKGYHFGFFWKGNTNNGATTYYSIQELNEEVKCTDGYGNPLADGSTSKIHAVTFDLEGKTYLGLEDWTDFDYQDWVFSCPQGLETVDPDDKLPDTEVTPDPEQPEEPETPDTPDTPSIDKSMEHVEVNLSLERRNSYLTAHLSIHVRSNTDVTVFIPIKPDYYCQADDMAIVQKHEENFMIHGGPSVTTYEINGHVVTLTVKFESDGVYVTTEGMCQEILDYLNEQYNDGLTFEVWIYTNQGTDQYASEQMDEIRQLLGGSTIEFEEMPPMYVNAFNKTQDGTVFEDDFTVTIVPSQRDSYDDGEEGWWYNGAPFNWIYTKK